MDFREFMQIAKELEVHYTLFSKIWEIGYPEFSESIPTAAVVFDKYGEQIRFIINPDFWKTRTRAQRKFIICHECLHAILLHGLRFSALKNANRQIANIAMDVVVNSMLVDRFNFKRELVDPDNQACWIDTVFKDHKDVKPGENFEYYYNRMMQNVKFVNLKVVLMDEHSFSEKKGRGEGGEGDQNDDQSEMMKHIAKTLSEEEKQALKEFFDNEKEHYSKQAGDTEGKQARLMKDIFYVPKEKWETVIKNWALKYLKDREEEQWIKPNRRFAFMSKDFFIPTESEIEIDERERIEVWFFQDTSGSCQHLAPRFFQAAMSLPQKRFVVKMHCFDTQVYETDLIKKELFGFGGTSFTCIEEYIKTYTNKHKIPYPEAVFIITDGYGDYVKMKLPHKWYWFLSTDYKDCIPKECNIFQLKDFE